MGSGCGAGHWSEWSGAKPAAPLLAQPNSPPLRKGPLSQLGVPKLLKAGGSTVSSPENPTSLKEEEQTSPTPSLGSRTNSAEIREKICPPRSPRLTASRAALGQPDLTLASAQATPSQGARTGPACDTLCGGRPLGGLPAHPHGLNPGSAPGVEALPRPAVLTGSGSLTRSLSSGSQHPGSMLPPPTALAQDGFCAWRLPSWHGCSVQGAGATLCSGPLEMSFPQ